MGRATSPTRARGRNKSAARTHQLPGRAALGAVAAAAAEEACGGEGTGAGRGGGDGVRRKAACARGGPATDDSLPPSWPKLWPKSPPWWSLPWWPGLLWPLPPWSLWSLSLWSLSLWSLSLWSLSFRSEPWSCWLPWPPAATKATSSAPAVKLSSFAIFARTGLAPLAPRWGCRDLVGEGGAGPVWGGEARELVWPRREGLRGDAELARAPKAGSEFAARPLRAPRAAAAACKDVSARIVARQACPAPPRGPASRAAAAAAARRPARCLAAATVRLCRHPTQPRAPLRVTQCRGRV